MVTFRRIWRTGKLHLHWLVVKPVATPLNRAESNQKRREGNEEQVQ